MLRLVHLWFALVLFGLGCQAQPQTEQPFRISVDVDLVVLDVTVRDQKGRVAPDLSMQDFEVREDGVRQSIRLFRHEDAPVAVGLVVDHSGSMRAKLADVIAAVRRFVQASRPDGEMFVVNFNDRATLGLPDAVKFSNRPEELTRAIAGTPAVGQTALYDAVVVAQSRLQAATREKKVLVVISDGGDNVSKHTLADVSKIAGESSISVYTIGIFDAADADWNPGALRHLAWETGGEAFFPKELDQVAGICEGIARDIRTQYTIGYVSTNPARAGGYRKVRVSARNVGGMKLVARTRSGYIARVKEEAAK